MTSGCRVPSDCQHELDVIANQMSTYSAIVNPFNGAQVIVMNENHVTVGCPLRSSRQDRTYIYRKRKHPYGTYLSDIVLC
jgi:hypothetical protein